MEENVFPRDLSGIEKQLLFYVLPENKQGYAEYREKINSFRVTGEGSFGGSNLILGKAGSIPDRSAPSLPVFALGNILLNSSEVSVIIHEECNDEIEFDLSYNNELPGIVESITGWSYSEWNPGDKAPGDGSEIREIPVLHGVYMLAIAPAHKKLWLHIKKTGVNILIPVTNYYNSLMIVKGIRNPEIVFKSARLFGDLTSYTNEELAAAFLAYNKYFKRVKV